MPEKLNESGTPDSEWVNVREIVVIQALAAGAGTVGLIACRSATAPI
jgi:hypothetical protein